MEPTSTSLSLATLLGGVTVGLAVAVPIGPMGVLCVERTMSRGFLAGLTTGLGAATVHLAYAAVAGLGFSAVFIGPLEPAARPVALISAALLFWFAFRLMRRPVLVSAERACASGWLSSYTSALLIGLSNPLTIVLFAAAMPAAAILSDADAIALATVGVFLGSISWWILLSLAVARLRGRLSPGLVVLANKAAGVALMGFGMLLLAKFLGFDLR